MPHGTCEGATIGAKRAGRAVAIGMAQRDRQCTMAAHGVAEDGLSIGVDGKILGDQFRQLFRDIAPHAVIARERLLRRIDIETGAEPEIVGIGGIAGHAFAARAGVGRDEDQSKFGAGAAEFAFSVTLAWVQVRPERYQTTGSLAPSGVRRDIDREGHVGPGLAAGVSIDALRSAV